MRVNFLAASSSSPSAYLLQPKPLTTTPVRPSMTLAERHLHTSHATREQSPERGYRSQLLQLNAPVHVAFRQCKSVSVLIASFGAQYPAHLYSCLRFAEHLAVCNAKLGAERFATPFS